MCWHHWFDGAISSNIYLRRVFHVHDDEKGINYQTKVRRCETPSLTHFIKKTCELVMFHLFIQIADLQLWIKVLV